MRRLLILAIAVALVGPPAAEAAKAPPTPPTNDPIDWHFERPSKTVGQPWRGRLVNGVQLPAQGQDFFTFDFPYGLSPSRSWRRWGSDRLLMTVLTVLRDYRAENPGASRVGIADLSRPQGGRFGSRYGGLGHQSHQNGRDIDILYPRRDRSELYPEKPSLIHRKLSQDLVDRFVDAGAQYVFVGPKTRLRGPRAIVGKLRFHDDHMHVRVY